jgi:hypothetical protein
MAREGVPLNVIQRQLGHADLGITSVYLQGIDSGEIVDVVHGRPGEGPPGHAMCLLFEVLGALRTNNDDNCAGAAADQVVSESVGFRLNDRGGRFSVQAL